MIPRLPLGPTPYSVLTRAALGRIRLPEGVCLPDRGLGRDEVNFSQLSPSPLWVLILESVVRGSVFPIFPFEFALCEVPCSRHNSWSCYKVLFQPLSSNKM